MILKKIAEGRTAEVFSFDGGKVVKLYRLGFPSENLHREAENCDLAFRQGLPTPQVVDLIQLNGRQGIIFEECIGSTMGERLQNHPNDVVPMAELLAELHIRIHKCSGKGLTSIHDSTKINIDRALILDASTREQLKIQLSNMPRGKNICHGDFHPDNVLLTEDGPALIDWVDATMGPPVADLVRTILLINYCDLPSTPKKVEFFVKMKATFLKEYQAKYLELNPLSEHTIALWTPVMAGARLSENAIRGSSKKNLVALINVG